MAVVSVDAYGYPHNVRYAALDTQDRPHLVYPMSSYPDYGFYYLTCDAGCTTASNWYTTTVTTPGLQPDVICSWSSTRTAGRGCWATTTTMTSWSMPNATAIVRRPPTGAVWGCLLPMYYLADYDFALRVDAQGHPRIAYYDGNGNNNVLLLCLEQCLAPHRRGLVQLHAELSHQRRFGRWTWRWTARGGHRWRLPPDRSFDPELFDLHRQL